MKTLSLLGLKFFISEEGEMFFTIFVDLNYLFLYTYTRAKTQLRKRTPVLAWLDKVLVGQMLEFARTKIEVMN